MRNFYRQKTPWLFKLVHSFIFATSIIMFAAIIYAAYMLYTVGISPEDIGEFFGRIANGWNKA